VTPRLDRGGGLLPSSANTKPHSWLNHTLYTLIPSSSHRHTNTPTLNNQCVCVCALLTHTGMHIKTHTHTRLPNRGCILDYCTDRVNIAIELPVRVDWCVCSEFVREDQHSVCVCVCVCVCGSLCRPNGFTQRRINDSCRGGLVFVGLGSVELV